MFGSGIGELNVYIRSIGGSSDPDKKIWGLNGDAGNNWSPTGQYGRVGYVGVPL